ncbi:MAG TPA: class I SAM-dependent methyltransferase [Anaerolineales bacterium]|nr:class I SAM-dependent methyltransferase [Anaerolineales bacterium]
MTQKLDDVRKYFTQKLEKHGATYLGVDYNSPESQEARFDELIRVIRPATEPYSLLDFGSGYGGTYDYLLHLGHKLTYLGYDIAESMVNKGNEIYAEDKNCSFTTNIEKVPLLDYAIASGTFNMKLDADYDAWTEIVINALHQMNDHARKGFSSNFLTKYSDRDRMRDDLYYADPLFIFDYCKNNFSRNVALLHDYELYDFTIIVRK